MKESLLYLCHRMPFPPNKGDKITTFNLLKFLSEHYNVYLGTFIDNKDDIQHRNYVSTYCKETFFVGINPTYCKIKALSAFLTGDPITLHFYQNTKMQHWVSDTVKKNNINKVFIYSSSMAQYVLHPQMKNMHKIMQFADIDSDKWRQFSNNQNWLMHKIYMREFRTLLKYEKYITEHFDLSCFISDTEVSLFKTMIDFHLHKKLKTLGNGIDSEFFSPLADINLNENFNLENENYIVFTGAMDYQPNIETVSWFIENIWIEVVNSHPESKFYIVGSSPTKAVLKLTQYSGVVVTGKVEDIRPYLINAKAAVAPMQIARGIQNKILEAMAMELPVLTNELGAEGLEDYLNEHLFITDSEQEMITWVKEKLQNPSYHAKESRAWLEKNYSWNAKLVPLLEYLES